MAYSLTWLPKVLQDAGLKVSECPGWETRGHGEMGKVLGVLCHHTATPGKKANMPTLDLLITGRPDLAGPLSQLGLGRDGTYYIVAAGRCYHAGAGSFQGITAGNSSFIGIEAENTGGSDDRPWPEVQIDAYHRGVAAILKHIGKGAEFCAGHKEYALPKGRKTDPSFDMEPFRAAVSAILQGDATAVQASAPVQPAARPTLRHGSENDAAMVKIVQAKIGVPADGVFGPNTLAAVRDFQTANDVTPDGIVGPQTWGLIS
jgi:peptidoglycan hydrolase-like protein with peptidoglycan-binding domain